MTGIVRQLAQLFTRWYGVRANVCVGARFHLGAGSVLWAPRSLSVGRDVYVGKGCTIECDGQIGNNVLIANRVGIVGRRDHDYRAVGVSIRQAPWVGDEPERLSTPVVIADDVWVGYGAIVLGGVTLGRGCVVSAGAVVTRDVPAYSIVAGSPATAIGERFSAQEILQHEAALYSPDERASAEPSQAGTR